MQVIALTGGIGSGKTTISDMFQELGIPVLDTDVIARNISKNGEPAYQEIIKTFGREIIDNNNEINRKKLASIIFASEEKRQQLENLLHPIIWQEVKAQLKQISKDNPYCIIVVPLLFENRNKSIPVKFDRILTVDTEVESQIKRTVNRDQSNEAIVKKVIQNQVSRDVRTNGSDDIILNTGDIDSLKEEVLKLHQHYLQLS